MTSTQPQVLLYAEVHQTSRTEAHRVAGSLSDAQFNWKPTPATWSVAEGLVHLNRVADAYLPSLEAAVERAKYRAPGPFAYGFLATKMIEGVQPGGPALRTGSSLDPSEGGARSAFERDAVLATFDAYVQQYVAVCQRAAGIDLARVKVRYPFMRLLRLPLGAFLQITGLHALRHIAQAERVTQRPGFPKAVSSA